MPHRRPHPALVLLAASADVGTVSTTPAVVVTAHTVRCAGGIRTAEIGSKDRAASVLPPRRATLHTLHARAADVRIVAPTAVGFGPPTAWTCTVRLRAASILEPEGTTPVAPARSALSVAASIRAAEVVPVATAGRLARSSHTASGAHDRDRHTPSRSTTEPRRAVERGHALRGTERMATEHSADDQPERDTDEGRDEQSTSRQNERPGFHIEKVTPVSIAVERRLALMGTFFLVTSTIPTRQVRTSGGSTRTDDGFPPEGIPESDLRIGIATATGDGRVSPDGLRPLPSCSRRARWRSARPSHGRASSRANRGRVAWRGRLVRPVRGAR
jgi:hypothetical protein